MNPFSGELDDNKIRMTIDMMNKKQVLFSILYFIFYEFTKERYNGIIR